MTNMREIEEELLDWINDSDERLLYILGSKVTDLEPMSFADFGLSNKSIFIAKGEGWLEENTRRIIEAYDDKRYLDQFELAFSFAAMIVKMLPAMPVGPLALLIARKIIKRRSATYEAPEIEGVVEEGPHTMKDDQNLTTDSLTHVFQGKLTREVVSMLLVDILNKPGMTFRIAQKKSGFSLSTLADVKSGRATLETGIQVLEALGLSVETNIRIVKPLPDTPTID